jgi:hypothetical protein
MYNLRQPFLSYPYNLSSELWGSLHLDIHLEAVYEISRAMPDAEREFTFGDSPDLSFDIPY